MLVITDPAPGSAELAYVERALSSGELALIPTDTVYGIAAFARDEAAVRALYALKGRSIEQPTAVIFLSIASLNGELPWLSDRATWAASALLPGPWTLIVDNPDGELPWLTGGRPGPLGVRVPSGALHLPPVAATSANLPGEQPIANVREIPSQLAEGIACAIHATEHRTGPASTVLDLTAWERGEGDVRVVRDEAGRAAQAIAALTDAPVVREIGST